MLNAILVVAILPAAESAGQRHIPPTATAAAFFFTVATSLNWAAIFGHFPLEIKLRSMTEIFFQEYPLFFTAGEPNNWREWHTNFLSRSRIASFDWWGHSVTLRQSVTAPAPKFAYIQRQTVHPETLSSCDRHETPITLSSVVVFQLFERHCASWRVRHDKLTCCSSNMKSFSVQITKARNLPYNNESSTVVRNRQCSGCKYWQLDTVLWQPAQTDMMAVTSCDPFVIVIAVGWTRLQKHSKGLCVVLN